MNGTPDLDQGDVVAFLRSGAAFDAEGPVEVVETHGAIVFLCGETAIKIKRAVRYDYVDLSTRERRAAMLRRELELNRPAAPMIYRDVVPVTREADGALALGGGGETVELALRMWRFPKSAELSEVAARGDLGTDLAARLGREIQAFHARCPVRDTSGGTLIEGILDELDRVFIDMARPLGEGRIARFHDLSRRALAERSDLLDSRAAAGRVRRGHGDLHLGNVVLLEGAPVLFDALEFDETLGTCDVLYDLAFLLMDLWHLDLRTQANVVLTHYLLAAAGEEDVGTGALPLFLAVRAGIRAMTTVQTDAARGAGESGQAGAYLDEAIAFLSPAPPRLVAVGGLSGTGKSLLARALAPELGAPPGAVHVRTDTERKAMAQVAPDQPLDAAAYTSEARHRVYRRMAERAEALLAAGRSVVLDATFLDPADRALAAEVSERVGVPFAGLWLDAPEATLLARVRGRATEADASDADAEVVRRQRARATPPAGWSRVDATGSPDETRQRAWDALRACRAGAGSTADGRG